MTEQRKQEVITILQGISNSFQPSEEEPQLTMFRLISSYNSTDGNEELIGGEWVINNCPSPLKDLI